ncbi:MAG: hypothetical protein FJ221_07440 [Lentisphaerae bacterium]|nr:hypothetical protein [Lentisphaerota bacterium]
MRPPAVEDPDERALLDDRSVRLGDEHGADAARVLIREQHDQLAVGFRDGLPEEPAAGAGDAETSGRCGRGRGRGRRRRGGRVRRRRGRGRRDRGRLVRGDFQAGPILASHRRRHRHRQPSRVPR